MTSLSMPRVRRAEQSPDSAGLQHGFRFSGFEVDFEKWELRKRGKRIKLQRKPFQILQRLLERPGELVSRSELAALLWPDLHVDFERSLNTAVNVLRQALGDSSRSCRFVETCPGVGYRFIAPVEHFGGAPLHGEAMSVSRSASESAGTADCRRGRFFYEKMTREGFARASAYYRAALEADPHCAPAYAGLAEIECRLAVWGLIPSIPAGRAAASYAEAALAIDSNLALAHATRATANRLLAAPAREIETAFLKAITLDPESAAVRCWYSDFLCASGRTKEALEQFDRAQDSEISSLVWNFQRSWTLYIRRDFRSTLECSWNTLMLEPGFAPAQYTLALAYEQLNSLEEAEIELENARATSGGHPAMLASLSHVLARRGDHDRALKLFEELQHLSTTQHVSHYSLALSALATQGKDAALQHLARASNEGDVLACWLPLDPRFDRLRN